MEDCSAENAGKVAGDVLRATLRHCWDPTMFTPAALEKALRVRYYNGVMAAMRREFRRVIEQDPIEPVRLEEAFAVEGDVDVDGTTEPYLFRGVFDRLDGHDGVAKAIVDYKSNPSNKVITEKSFATTVKTYYQLQAVSYVVAFRKLYGRDPLYMRFENVESGIHYDVPLDKIDKEVMNKAIREYIRGVKAEDYTPCGNSFLCDRCEYRNVCKHREF